MGRGRDPFWAHAEKVNGCLKFKCNYCKRDFAGGASRIKAHLAGVSGHDIVACDAVPPDVQNQARATQKKREAQATQGTNKKLKSASTSASKLKNKGKEEYMAEIVLNDVVDRLIANAFSLHANDAQKRQSSDESVRIWLMELRDVAYDADKVLDEFSYESLSQEVQIQNLTVDQDGDLEKWDTLKGLSNSIEQLIHLRLLHIFDIGITELPKSITKLYNLQTLRIEECPCLMKLPEDLSDLINLRHICIIDCEFTVAAKNIGRLTCLQTLSDFCAGRDEGYRMKELGPLKNLKGEIDIYFLENVENEEEAKSAKLKEKEIFNLGLFWSSFGRELDNYDNDEKVLEGLHPHPNLKSLKIQGYQGKKFPSWDNDLSLFPNLIHIKLIWCTKCEEVPTLGHLPCLRVLEIDGMEKKFVIQDCTHLSSLRGVPSVIQHLEIIRCGIDELPSGLHLCTSLQYLGIENCLNLKPDLGEVFHSLIHLRISNCPDLRLKLLREGRLKALVIGGFIEELDAFPILRYPSIRYSHASLKKLILLGRPTLNSLPNEIQLFTALEELQIWNFNGMEALPDWFSYLSSLQKLFLYHCKKLMYLPILHLTNLKHLRIDNCRNLEERCAEGSGAEWFQIGHVPNIRINGKYIQGKDFDNFDRLGFDGFWIDVFDD
ncbi:hypothetical protein CMV_017630 [Castanea mollissima]|uniref:BED-type domain-containing protein n=1 Tax=Castanea mollissima TaxID=60419 RepID=A0A8J4VH04_9ROSI|nr:hypothetical protein CMV_017630 [Castanea mollissima]